jgi:hypothetical protein
LIDGTHFFDTAAGDVFGFLLLDLTSSTAFCEPEFSSLSVEDLADASASCEDESDTDVIEGRRSFMFTSPFAALLVEDVALDSSVALTFPLRFVVGAFSTSLGLDDLDSSWIGCEMSDLVAVDFLVDFGGFFVVEEVSLDAAGLIFSSTLAAALAFGILGLTGLVTIDSGAVFSAVFSLPVYFFVDLADLVALGFAVDSGSFAGAISSTGSCISLSTIVVTDGDRKDCEF